MIVIIDHFLRMEDLSLNRNDKYCKVEHKLEMLAQSKLQNLNTNTLRKIEDRILSLEKGVCEESASNEKIVREYRLLLRKNEEQWHQLQTRTVQATNERTNKIAELKDLMANYFCREDGQSKEIYKQGPAIFEEKTEKIAKELAGQIIERREETAELQGRVEDALLVFKENMHAHFEELDETVGGKIGELRANCEQLRKDIEAKTESKRKAESSIMDHLRETVCQIKQTLNSERVERQRNRDKLLNLVNNAREQISRA